MAAKLPTPNSGKSTSGSSEVTGIGTASVIHQIAIHSAEPAASRPGIDRLSGRTSASSSPAIGPRAIILKLIVSRALAGASVLGAVMGRPSSLVAAWQGKEQDALAPTVLRGA